MEIMTRAQDNATGIHIWITAEIPEIKLLNANISVAV